MAFRMDSVLCYNFFQRNLEARGLICQPHLLLMALRKAACVCSFTCVCKKESGKFLKGLETKKIDFLQSPSCVPLLLVKEIYDEVVREHACVSAIYNFVGSCLTMTDGPLAMWL